MLPQPHVDVEKEVLFAPQHPCQRLPHHIGRILVDTGRRDRPIERVSLTLARLDDLIEPSTERLLGTGCYIAQPQPDDGGCPGADAQLVVRGGFGPGIVRVDRILPVSDDTVVDPIFDIGCWIGGAEEPLIVRVVFGEQQERASLAIEKIVAE
jgi:hypothetical protein